MVRGKAGISYMFLVLLVIAVNLLGQLFFKRIDLTQEKRFTLSRTTKTLVDSLDDVAYFTIYLDGKFPKQYQHLKNAISDLLYTIRLQSQGKIDFEFQDVLGNSNNKEKENILRQFSEKGLLIVRPELDDEKSISNQFIIPAGVIFYQNNEYPINFLKRKFGASTQEEINISIEQIEYEIDNILRLLVSRKAPKIAFLEGHAELTTEETADIRSELSKFYKVSNINLNLNDTLALQPIAEKVTNSNNGGQAIIEAMLDYLQGFDGLIVAKPRKRFEEIEKFLLDQYIMQGGKIIFLVESLVAEMDSIQKYGQVATADYDLNLDDLLFRFGVRINPNLIQDLNCHGIPVVMKNAGNRPQILPWVFYPLFNPSSTHPIVKNLPAIWGRFVSSIDTTSNKNIRKTPLLQSSKNSRVAYNPVNIHMNLVQLGMDRNTQIFKQANQIGGVLLEGEFKSAFSYRKGYQNTKIPFIPSILQNRMIVLSDGDFIRNQVVYSGDALEPLPLGFDRFASKQMGIPVKFENKRFFLNCVDYLLGYEDIINVRSKKVALRLLNKTKVKKEKSKWILLNMALPVVLIVIFGIFNTFLRRSKYQTA
ncbi:MAG: gliding motility-associated ABC transporter substrate-binding protein GldG [Bacteroidota bacterium]|nr:gliding motility-associated ABC transporter substrate-binding protein GldG [Bacteroidota bacterium]